MACFASSHHSRSEISRYAHCRYARDITAWSLDASIFQEIIISLVSSEAEIFTTLILLVPSAFLIAGAIKQYFIELGRQTSSRRTWGQARLIMSRAFFRWRQLMKLIVLEIACRSSTRHISRRRELLSEMRPRVAYRRILTSRRLHTIVMHYDIV